MNLSVQIYPIKTNYQQKTAFKGATNIVATKEVDKQPVAVAEGAPVSAKQAIMLYLTLIEYGHDEEAMKNLSSAVKKFGADKVKQAAGNAGADLIAQGEGRIERELTRGVLKATGNISESDLPEDLIPVASQIISLRDKLSIPRKINDPDRIAMEEELNKKIKMVKEKIASLQKQLEAYGAGLDRYDQIEMDKIQKQIKALRIYAPLDKTNLNEVLLASPEEIFTPITADNIKGKGISFRPVIPTDPEKLKDVTYKAVPLYTHARTVKEMITIAKRDGVKIELVQDSNGNYIPAVKNIWGGWFKLDRDSYVLQYGEIPADDEYVDHEWAKKNKYINKQGKYVIMDCAIVASDKKTVADIMQKSYVKADGSPITSWDRYAWDGFEVHKNPDGIINAVAYNEPRIVNTLEGPIETDVTMGDVEGNVYSKYKDLEKQILKNKIQANPNDPNSQKFIDLVKAGDKDAAIALLRQATEGVV